MFAQAPVPDWSTASPEVIRAANDVPLPGGPPQAMAKVEDISMQLPGRTIAARLYIPEGAESIPPLLIYYHGGGWVVGTLDTHDSTCRALAGASNAAILSIAYRLAPEHAYPAPLDDCHDALVWASQNAALLGIDPTRLAVGGDSAGANLAGAVAIMARDNGGPELRHQLLIYPVTDMDFERQSYTENGSGEYFLSTEAMHWFWQRYLGSTPVSKAPLAAILQQQNLKGVAAATIYTAEYDPLRDEGMLYAERLRSAEVAVDAEIAPGMIHGFFSMFEAVPDAREWIDKAGAKLKAAFT